MGGEGSRRQHLCGSRVPTLSENLCLLTGLFRPLTFQVIIDFFLLKRTTLLSIFYLFCLSFGPFISFF